MTASTEPSLSPEEGRSLEALAAILSRSPRSAKRFVNTYRLYRKTLETSDPPSQERLAAVQFLLALLAGVPLLAGELFAAIRDAAASPSPKPLLELVTATGAASGGEREREDERARLEEAFRPESLPLRAIRVGELAAQLDEVSVFTFQAGLTSRGRAAEGPALTPRLRGRGADRAPR